MRHLRLTHADLHFWVDVRLIERQGRWLAIAILADEPGIGTSDDPREAIAAALAALGEPYAAEMAHRADLTSQVSDPQTWDR